MKISKIKKNSKFDTLKKLAIKTTDTYKIKGGWIGFEDLIDA